MTNEIENKYKENMEQFEICYNMFRKKTKTKIIKNKGKNSKKKNK